MPTNGNQRGGYPHFLNLSHVSPECIRICECEMVLLWIYRIADGHSVFLGWHSWEGKDLACTLNSACPHFVLIVMSLFTAVSSSHSSKWVGVFPPYPSLPILSLLTIHSILRNRPLRSAAILPVFYVGKGNRLECCSREISHCRKGVKSAISTASSGTCRIDVGVYLFGWLVSETVGHILSSMRDFKWDVVNCILSSGFINRKRDFSDFFCWVFPFNYRSDPKVNWGCDARVTRRDAFCIRISGAVTFGRQGFL